MKRWSDVLSVKRRPRGPAKRRRPKNNKDIPGMYLASLRTTVPAHPDLLAPSTCARTVRRTVTTSNGCVSGQVAKPNDVAQSSTALAASPARSRECRSSDAVPTTTSSPASGSA
ncbi:hypothetical protein [Actinocrispum wychmicini]|uniref:Uncharacterized protein n=1 Tax=Actinocrispum wychmicini TaxID=1213861 RepID=A0A4R2JXA3_9PSEU|nr:hypothetical protein [Actinocrispum wychmicini]TCO61966.1 hypothetical protein EV192_102103 [Actinocrispum wychmicini]